MRIGPACRHAYGCRSRKRLICQARAYHDTRAGARRPNPSTSACRRSYRRSAPYRARRLSHASGRQPHHHVGEHRVGVDVRPSRRSSPAARNRASPTRTPARRRTRPRRPGRRTPAPRSPGPPPPWWPSVNSGSSPPSGIRVNAEYRPGMVVGVAAVGAGHHHYRVVAGAALADGVEHLDDVADHPHPHRAAQVVEAVDVVVQRRALGAELGGQRVDRQRVPAFAVEERQRGVDDGVAAQLRRSRDRLELGAMRADRASVVMRKLTPLVSVESQFTRSWLSWASCSVIVHRSGSVAGFIVWIDQVMTSPPLAT